MLHTEIEDRFYHTCSWGPRSGGLDLPGRGVGIVILSGQDAVRHIQIFKKMIRVDPYLVTAASRPSAVLSSAHSAKPTARGDL